MIRPYLIVTHNYRRTSAGARVLHRLCHLLNGCGLNAWVTSPVMNPEWNELYADDDLQHALARTGIVVYPEVEPGNPLEAKRVVRYLLNQPGYIRGDATFDSSESLFCYGELLRRHVPADDRILTVPVIDTGIFNNNKFFLRQGSVYWLGRNKQPTVSFDSMGMSQITSDWPATMAEVALVFQAAEVFYTFSVFTALVIEARLCGCPVRVMHDSQFSREEFEATPLGKHGMAWGEEEIECARQTVGQFGKVYEEYVGKFPEQLKTFVRLSQEMA